MGSSRQIITFYKMFSIGRKFRLALCEQYSSRIIVAQPVRVYGGSVYFEDGVAQRFYTVPSILSTSVRREGKRRLLEAVPTSNSHELIQ